MDEMSFESIYSSITVKTLQNKTKELLSFIEDNWNSIPIFEPGQTIPADGRLYKFFGMIQDMPNPVYYFLKYEVIHNINGTKEIRSGKYIESLTCEENETLELESEACENDERRPYFMLPVPGLNDWVKEAHKEIMTHRTSPYTTPNVPQFQNEGKKRAADEMELEQSENEVEKRHCNEATQDSRPVSDECNKSLNDKNSYGCLVSMYDVPVKSIKLNDVLEVVGFLYESPGQSDVEDEFDNSYKPPSPFTPRMHVVMSRNLKNYNPLLKTLDSSANQYIIDQMLTIRKDLQIALTQLFFGNKMVADFIILHLISHIYRREDTDVILGKFSLNLCQLPENFPVIEFYNIVSKIVTKAQYLSFTIDNLNECVLIPKKNYTTGNLETGLLQLSDNTHLIIDEVTLQEGKLLDNGVRNVNALSSLIKRQKLDYDFTYYSVGFETNIPVMTLSHSKSLLPADFILPVSQSDMSSTLEESFASVNQFLSAELLNNIRKYLSIAANLPFTMPEEMNSVIQNEFVRLRQMDPKFTGDDLHDLLVIARFLTLSYCETTLTKHIWEEATTLLTFRMEACAEYYPQR